MIDEVQIELAIKNIVINVKEGVSEDGIIRVYAQNIEVTEKDNLLLKNGEYIKVSLKTMEREYLKKTYQRYLSHILQQRRWGVEGKVNRFFNKAIENFQRLYQRQ